MCILDKQNIGGQECWIGDVLDNSRDLVIHFQENYEDTTIESPKPKKKKKSQKEIRNSNLQMARIKKADNKKKQLMNGNEELDKTSNRINASKLKQAILPSF